MSLSDLFTQVAHNPVLGLTCLLVLAVVVIGGGAGRHFQIYRPKQQRAAATEEDYDEANYDGPEGFDDDPPWDEDDDGERLE